jgi:hypothetical protein
MENYYTTTKQSYKLLDLGIDPSTSDMYYLFLWFVDNIKDSITSEETPIIKSKNYEAHEGDVPCWSAGALHSLLASLIENKCGDTNYNITVSPHKNGWKLSYHHFSQSKVHDEIVSDNYFDCLFLAVCKLQEEKVAKEFLLKFISKDYEKGDIVETHQFMQQWASTALGFDACGGEMMTNAVTTVIKLKDDSYVVYFDRKKAYEVKNPNNNFFDSLKRQEMLECKFSNLYETEKDKLCTVQFTFGNEVEFDCSDFRNQAFNFIFNKLLKLNSYHFLKLYGKYFTFGGWNNIEDSYNKNTLTCQLSVNSNALYDIIYTWMICHADRVKIINGNNFKAYLSSLFETGRGYLYGIEDIEILDITDENK